MAKRYFEFKDAKSHKFWEVSVSAKKVNIRYGKVGTDGQTSVKELSTPAEAKAHAEKQAAGKVKKGYKEVKAKAVKNSTKKVVKKKVSKKAVKKTAKKTAKKAVKKAVKKKVVKKKVTKKAVKKTAKKKAVKKKVSKKALKKKTVKKTAKKAVKKTPAKGKGDKVDKEARKAVLKAVKEDGCNLENADKVFKADREIVLAAVKQDGWALEHADKSLKADRKLVLVAVKNNGMALEYVDKNLKADPEVVLTAVKNSSNALIHADKSLRVDQNFILKVMKYDLMVISHADNSLRANREFILKAVQHDGHALMFATKKLKADREIVIVAVKNEKEALQWASEKLQKDNDIKISGNLKDVNTTNPQIINVKILGNCLGYMFEEITKKEFDFWTGPGEEYFNQYMDCSILGGETEPRLLEVYNAFKDHDFDLVRSQEPNDWWDWIDGWEAVFSSSDIEIRQLDDNANIVRDIFCGNLQEFVVNNKTKVNKNSVKKKTDGFTKYCFARESGFEKSGTINIIKGFNPKKFSFTITAINQANDKKGHRWSSINSLELISSVHYDGEKIELEGEDNRTNESVEFGVIGPHKFKVTR